MNPEDQILRKFAEICAIPRGTTHEAAIRQWLIEWAQGRGYGWQTDAIGNLAVSIPTSPARAHQGALILQCHLDMVWQKTPESAHDFLKDPIRIERDGDWLTAGGTTLGADNGIAIALVMVLVEDEALPHPPLELLFTVQEESGVVGASQLDPGLLSGKTLINLDSEKEGWVTVGCIGGGDLTITLPVQWEAARPWDDFYQITVSGLRGGHSGEDIHKQRANANKLLAEIFACLPEPLDLRLDSFHGGSARNAIPREAEAIFACPHDQSALLRDSLGPILETTQGKYLGAEPGIAITLTPAAACPSVIGAAATQNALRLLDALPQGVAAYYSAAPEFVETSNNLGIVELRREAFLIVSNNRSLRMPQVVALTERMEAVAQAAGATTARSAYVSPWQPDLESPLLGRCIAAYQALFHAQPKINLSHGGLECGIISERCGGLDAISLGPTIEFPHSPDERCSIPSLAKTWALVRALVGAEG